MTLPITDPRLAQQLAFITEIDRLKEVVRNSLLVSGSRLENSAEHSWHLAMLAITLHEHATAPIDVLHVVKMVLIHDIVEIDAGDIFAYDAAGNVEKAEQERAAADRIFGLLPDDQARELRCLWDEFEANKTPEARFALAVDRLMPLLHNYYNNGGSWQKHGVTSTQVRERMAPIEHGSPALWALTQTLIEECITKGYLTT